MSDESQARDTHPLCEDNTLLTSGREKLNQMGLTLIDGMYFLGSRLFPDLEGNVRAIKDFDLQDGDVILCGYPRSGSHWMFEILHMILDDHHGFTDRTIGDFNLELMGDQAGHTVKTLGRPRVFTTHIWPSFFPNAVLEKKVKVVYVFRNPKDALVSWFRLTSNIRKREASFQGSWDEFLELQLAGEYVYGSWFDHLRLWDKFVKENPQAEVFSAQFEKLGENPRDVIAELCRFLGKPEELAENIADVTSFENMKSGTQEKQQKENSRWVSKDASMSMVKGRVGAWRSEFTQTQNERFNAFFTQKMDGNMFVDKVKTYI